MNYRTQVRLQRVYSGFELISIEQFADYGERIQSMWIDRREAREIIQQLSELLKDDDSEQREMMTPYGTRYPKKRDNNEHEEQQNDAH